MRKKDLNVGDLVKVMQVTKEGNVAGWVPEMQNFVGKTYIIQQNNGSYIGLPYDGWLDNVLYFDVRDVRRIRKAKVEPVIRVAPEAAVKAEEVAKVENTLLDELIVQCKADGGVGLCSFAWQFTNGNKKYAVQAPCHARLMSSYDGGQGVDNVALAMYDYLGGSHYEAEYKAHVKYIIQDSPWAHIFNEKNIDAILKSGVTLNTDVPCNNIMAACVSLREGNEFPQHLTIFQGILDAGFSGHTAYVVSRGFKGTIDAPIYIGVENGHKVLSHDLSADDLAKFFIKGYSNKEGSYKKGHQEYGIARWIAGTSQPTITTLLKKASIVTVVQGPFGKENKTVVTTESLLAVCKEFEDMLNKWRAK